MNMTYTKRNYYVRRYSRAARRSIFWNKVSDGILCAASTMGVMAALFFLLTL
jgi:hypothetical protein